MKTLTLIEHNFIFTSTTNSVLKAQSVDSNIIVPKDVFDELKMFILKNSQDGKESICDFLIPSYKKGFGEVLKAKNYVGVIQTKTGITIEILPKIYGIVSDNNPIKEIVATKKILLKMLKSLKRSNFRISNFANLDLSVMSLMDIFVTMFLEELDILVKQGLRKSYISRSENIYTLKGKLDFNKNIKFNIIHKEKFFVNYDEHEINRPENLLIKSTLLFLLKKTKNNATQQRVRKFLFIFDQVDSSKNIENDFSRCKSNRLTKNYEKLLMWCRIFLSNKTFSSYKGSELAFALLFPMERIFEDYVAHLLRKSYAITTQKMIGHLLQKPSKQYKMKPDIIFVDHEVIADTKWKIIDSNHRVSQSDLYQMFAYGTHPDRLINNTKRIILIYPFNVNFTQKKCYYMTNGLEIIIYPLDLVNHNKISDILDYEN